MTAPKHHVDPKLLEILVCPLSKGPLEYDRDNNELISHKAGLAFPIRDGIPIMLPGEARSLDDAAKRSLAPGRPLEGSSDDE